VGSGVGALTAASLVAVEMKPLLKSKRSKSIISSRVDFER